MEWNFITHLALLRRVYLTFTCFRRSDPGTLEIVLWFAVVRSALSRRYATCGKFDVSVIDIRRRLMIKCSDRKT
jgi:hypothetical protein